QQAQAAEVERMHLGADAVQSHLGEAPIEYGGQRLLHQPLAAQRWRELELERAVAPGPVPGEQAAGTDQARIVLQLQAPVRGRLARGREAGDQLLDRADVGQRLAAEPAHQLRLLVDLEQAWR